MKMFSTRYSAAALNIGMLVLRTGMSVLMLAHGYDKLINFWEYQKKFMNFLGTGNMVSLGMVVFAEFFCSIFLILGLMTRLAVIPLIITMFVALYMAHNGKIFGEGEHAALFICGYITLFLIGPGRFSVDGLITK